MIDSLLAGPEHFCFPHCNKNYQSIWFHKNRAYNKGFWWNKMRRRQKNLVNKIWWQKMRRRQDSYERKCAAGKIFWWKNCAAGKIYGKKHWDAGTDFLTESWCIVCPVDVVCNWLFTHRISEWCVRCLLITESPKTPSHYRYQI